MTLGQNSELKITGTLPPIGLAYDWMKPNFTSSRACFTSRHARLCCETFSRDHFGSDLNVFSRANGSKIVVYLGF